MGMGGITEQELRDAWARWTERRPDDLDWQVEIKVGAGDRDALASVHRTTFVWAVELTCGSRTLGRWEVGSARAALDVIDTLTELFEHRAVIDAALSGFGDMMLTHWVWERMRGR